MDVRHISAKNAYLNAYVPRVLWEEFVSLFPSQAEACCRLRGVLHNAIVREIAEAQELHDARLKQRGSE